MRLILLTAISATTLTLAGPNAVLAHPSHDLRHHHKAKTKAHHARFRFVHIGASTAATPGGSSSPGAGPTAPATPPAPGSAGTVASYANEILTLNLNGGSTVSGKVTSHTKIECVNPATEPPAGTNGESFDQSQGDDSSAGDNESPGDVSHQDNRESSESQADENNGDGTDEGGEVKATPEAPCNSSALVTGAVVRGAELRIGPGGNEFESITLGR